MEWIDISLWIVVIAFVFSGDIKSLIRSIFLILIFIMRSVSNINHQKESLDFIIISIGISVFLIFLVSRIYSKKKAA